MSDSKTHINTIWGIALLIMGVAVFFRIPYVMGRIAHIQEYASGQIFIRFSLYLMAVLLIGGGVKKLLAAFKQQPKNLSDQ